MITCNLCKDELTKEEMKSPNKDKDGNIICDECHFNEYMYLCCICEDHFEDNFKTKIFPKYILVSEYIGNENGLTAGIYEILKYPFYADGMIEFHLFRDAIKRVCNISDGFEDSYILDYVCEDCKQKAEQFTRGEKDEKDKVQS